MPYVTKTEVENYAGVTLSAGATASLDMIISSVQNFIENYCGGEYFAKRWFQDDDASKTFYYDGNDCIRIAIDDLRELTSLSVFGNALTVDEDFYLLPHNAVALGIPFQAIELIQPETRINANSRMIQNGSNYTFEKGQKSIVVVGKFGFSKTVPNEIKLATLKLIKGIIGDSASDDGVKEIKSETLDDYRVDYVALKETADSVGVTKILDQFVKKPLIVRQGINKIS